MSTQTPTGEFIPPQQTPPVNMSSFAQQRDTLVPREVTVFVPPSASLPEGKLITLPRLTLKRSLQLSRWIDDISQDENVRQKLVEFTSGMDTTDGMLMIFGINSMLAQLPETKVAEFFSIITGEDMGFIMEYWEVGWGFEALKAAFQSQGFGKMFQNAAEAGAGQAVVENTDTTNPTPENVVSMPSYT